MKATEVLLGNLLDGVIRVVYYFRNKNEHGRGVVDFESSELLDVLMWVESTLGIEKEKVSTVF